MKDRREVNLYKIRISKCAIVGAAFIKQREPNNTEVVYHKSVTKL